MRKLKLLLVAFLAMCGLCANAADIKVDQRFSTIPDLDGKLFAIVNETNNVAMGIGISGHGNGWDMYFGTYAEAFGSNACFYKIEAAKGEGVTGYYYLRTYKADKTMYTAWGNTSNMGYFNSQTVDKSCCFALGLNNQNGQDGKDLAVWNIEVSSGKFALKNKGTGKYLHADNLPAKYDDPFYFTFCTLVDFDQLKANYTALKEKVLALDDDDTIFEGEATVNIDAAEEAIEDASSRAEINAAMEKLRTAATNFVTSVTVKEGKYFDMSEIWIVNPSVRKNIEGWTIENSVGSGSNGVTNYEETEFYQRTFDFYQTLTLPVGTYELGVTGFHRAGNHKTYFYAGDDKILIPGVESSVVNSMADAKKYFDAGNGKVSLKFLEDELTTLKMGVVNNDTETDKWTIFRDFTLYYYGKAVDYTVYKDRWATLKVNAEKAKTDNPEVTGNELKTLNDSIADAPADNAKKAEYLKKIGALENAISAFNAAAPHYKAYLAYKKESEDAFGTSLFSSIAAPTTAAEADVAVQNLNIAQYNEVNSKYKFSCAGVIGDFGTWTGTATVAGEPKEPNYLDYEHWSGKIHAYYEQAKDGWGNAKGWTIKYEKKCRLPKGKYVLKVAARASANTTSKVSCSATENTVTLPKAGNTAKGINKAGVASWTDGEFAHDGNGFGWQWRFLPFELTEMTEVTMTFEASASSQYQWMSISDGDLLSLENIAKDVSYSEEGNYEIESHDIANVSMIRTIKEGFNTLVLPFSLTSKQVEETFGEGTVIYNFSENSENANAAKIKFQKGDGSITANKPVLVKAAKASKKQNFVGVRVEYSPEVKVAGKNFDFIGSYRMGWIDEGNYFVGNGALYKSEGNTFSNAFRAYIKPKTAGARVESFEIEGEGEATGIKAVETSSRINNGKIYNLNGQEVKNGQKGIFIQNGKKFILR